MMPPGAPVAQVGTSQPTLLHGGVPTYLGRCRLSAASAASHPRSSPFHALLPRPPAGRSAAALYLIVPPRDRGLLWVEPSRADTAPPDRFATPVRRVKGREAGDGVGRRGGYNSHCFSGWGECMCVCACEEGQRGPAGAPGAAAAGCPVVPSRAGIPFKERWEEGKGVGESGREGGKGGGEGGAKRNGRSSNFPCRALWRRGPSRGGRPGTAQLQTSLQSPAAPALPAAPLNP